MKAEYYCAQCGRLLIIRAPKDYRYRCRDWRKDSETKGRTLTFCSPGCMSRFEEQYHRRKYNAGFRA